VGSPRFPPPIVADEEEKEEGDQDGNGEPAVAPAIVGVSFRTQFDLAGVFGSIVEPTQNKTTCFKETPRLVIKPPSLAGILKGRGVLSIEGVPLKEGGFISEVPDLNLPGFARPPTRSQTPGCPCRKGLASGGGGSPPPNDIWGHIELSSL
jgi:hypothetical protein